jgi:hypothetical protein
LGLRRTELKAELTRVEGFVQFAERDLASVLEAVADRLDHVRDEGVNRAVVDDCASNTLEKQKQEESMMDSDGE